ncbi:major facilitator superfamily transporter [Colletotrichum graminicola]|nr:major facilitator superfamily transporter [Colletotrichum graminicola]
MHSHEGQIRPQSATEAAGPGPSHEASGSHGRLSDPPPGSGDADTGIPKLSGTIITLTMTPLCLSATLSALDTTIVTTAVPNIVASLQSVAGYIWVGSAFILGFTAVTPVWGSVADLWGRKPIILPALTIFLAGSLLCALAPHMDALIAGRAIQGVGASGMGVMVNTIICDMFSLRDRGLYLAITSIIWAIGSAIGPILGGIFTTRLEWVIVVLVNLENFALLTRLVPVPIGGLVFIVLFFFLDLPSPDTLVWAGLKAIDWTGSALCMGGSLMVLLSLDFGDVTHPWSSATVICLLVFGLVAIGIFLVNEWKFAANPVPPLRLLSTVAFAGLASVLNLFVSEHHLSSDRKAVVLGIDRNEADSQPQPLVGGEEIPLESSGREDTQQNRLRNRGAA